MASAPPPALHLCSVLDTFILFVNLSMSFGCVLLPAAAPCLEQLDASKRELAVLLCLEEVLD